MKDFKLDDQKINPGFKTPDNYFDAFPQRLEQQLAQKPVISLFSKHRKFIYAAAAILVLALMLPLFTSDTDNTSDLDTATLETYLAYHSDISQFEMLTLLEQEDINAMEIELPVEDAAIEEALSTNSNFENLLIEL